MSMITASTWVPRGAAAQFPTKYDVDEEELARISRLAKLKLEDAEEDLDEARNGEAEGKHTASEEDGDVNMTLAKGYVFFPCSITISSIALIPRLGMLTMI